jgi:hypothetical protein
MLEPTCDLFWRPEHSQLVNNDSGQGAVLNRVAALWAPRSLTSRFIGLICPLAFTASIALDLPADRR